MAERLGAPIPPLVHIRSVSNLADAERLRYPCVLKPAIKDYDYGRRFKKAYVVGSVGEARELFAEIGPVMSDLVLQEWIDGDDADIFFCLQYIGADAQVISSFCGRKVRSWPPRIGGTASCTAAWDESEVLGALTCDFFRKVGFSGMGRMEYKRDRRDGRFYMIEPTVARTDYQQEVATVHGVNVPLAAYRYEAGLAAVERQIKRDHRAILWRESQTDRWSAAAQGEDPRFRKLPVCDAYWRWRDPGPWLRHMEGRMALRMRQCMGRLAFGSK